MILLALLLIAVPLALVYNVQPDGAFSIPGADELARLMPWRAPRVTAALVAGALLAVSGLILQRMTGNPAASLELLGVSAGAALGVTVSVLFIANAGYWAQMMAAGTGAGLVLALLLTLSASGRISGEKLLLTGIALGAFISAILTLLLASGDPRVMLIATWMAGSTYDVEPQTARYLRCAARSFS
ncbi:iron chelate uptake ABC transporter family permease subunit [Breoghania sp.]|uniref:iron chelate uptake ABC transporter family permease subunit n=1 Tax=Breoghania sp. TaxID=2065378 RepID=UPI00262286DA|nr:iron chelate uptake ABC transporter family permease subunit [Breoghania sp.]MDJ0930602.1 iron chelate uptake ABC transporter family permease subunit [Breoghania sp.]